MTDPAVTDNLNVVGLDDMPAPEQIKTEQPLTAAGADAVRSGRAHLMRILDRQDARLFVVVGPCSIHDPHAALEYAQRLRSLAEEVGDALLLVMRVYFEKPRTATGWKGYINDPDMDDSFHIGKGMRLARELLLAFAELGLPTGSEALDPLSPQYLADLISWYAIGARTTESQTHREMASGLSTPVGFKNGTDGGLEVAIMRTRGNRLGHLVLRGGGGRPNYDTVSVRLAEAALVKSNLAPNIVVDCSHSNSLKDPSLQPLVFMDCVHQIKEGNRSIVGLMLESNLVAGTQPIPADLSQLRYGVSVTDACIDWATTADLLRRAAGELRPVMAQRPN
jgi:3-deoxy-7-phosphoheptulonate synthase